MTKKKSWKKNFLTLFFVLFSAGVIIATAINEFTNNKNAAKLTEVHIDGWLVLPAVLCFIAMITLEYGKYVLMITRCSAPDSFTKKEAWKLAFRVVMLGRYYDKITPAAVGGQPVQILQMRKTGKIPIGMTTAIPIFSMISGQLMFLLVAIPCFLFTDVASKSPVLIATAWFGLLFYAFWPAMVAGTMFFPKPTAKFINFIVKFLAKIKLVKNPNKAVRRVEEEVSEYAKHVKMLTREPKVAVPVLLMSFLSNSLMSSIPYFVLRAFGGNIDFIECFLLTIGVEAAIYFAPTPGNSGVAEGTFYVIFSRLSTGYVFWAMMLWRLFTYYIYIIVGPLIYLSSYINKKRKGTSNDHQK